MSRVVIIVCVYSKATFRIVCVCVCVPVHGLLQMGVFLAAVLQPLLQLVVFLHQGCTLSPAMLQFGRPPGQSLPQLLALLLLVCRKTKAF